MAPELVAMGEKQKAAPEDSKQQIAQNQNTLPTHQARFQTSGRTIYDRLPEGQRRKRWESDILAEMERHLGREQCNPEVLGQILRSLIKGSLDDELNGQLPDEEAADELFHMYIDGSQCAEE